MSQFKPNPWLVISILGGIFYPPLIYFGMGRFPPMLFVLIGCAIIGLRLLGFRDNPAHQIWKTAFLITSFCLITLLLLNPRLAVLAYPVMMSLCVAAVFWRVTLLPAPPLLSASRRIREPNLSPDGVVYTRHVTEIWTCFLLFNAAISAATGIWGSLTQWTLWNGLLSYIFIGTLFLAEFIVRQRVRK